MQYTVKCEILARLMKALDYITDTSADRNCLRLEENYAIATNGIIMVVQKLDHMNPSEPIHIINDPVLRKQCEEEGKFSADLTIVANPVLNYYAASTSFGYNYVGNPIFDQPPNALIHDWKTVVAPPPTKPSRNHMVWNAENITNLGRTSPSGVLVFAANIDGQVPTIIRDANDSSWFAVFVPGTVEPTQAAVVPEWFK